MFFTAKGDELPKKPLGIERPIVLTPITSVQVDNNADQLPVHPHTNNPVIKNQPPPVPPTKPVFQYTQAPCPVLQTTQAETGTSETGAAEERLVSSSARNSPSLESKQTLSRAGSCEWPPPYLPTEADVHSVDSLNLPELPPPPPPCLDPESGVYLSPSGDSLPLAPLQEELSTSPSSYRAQRQFGKFPVNFYIPASPGARRPSEQSHYDNLSEEEEQPGEKIPEIQENSGLSSSQPWPSPASIIYIPESAPAPPLKPATEYTNTRSCVASNCTFIQPPPEFAEPPSAVSSPLLSYAAVQSTENQNDIYRNQLQRPRLPVKPAALSSRPTAACADFNRMCVPTR